MIAALLFSHTPHQKCKENHLRDEKPPCLHRDKKNWGHIHTLLPIIKAILFVACLRGAIPQKQNISLWPKNVIVKPAAAVLFLICYSFLTQMNWHPFLSSTVGKLEYTQQSQCIILTNLKGITTVFIIWCTVKSSFENSSSTAFTFLSTIAFKSPGSHHLGLSDSDRVPACDLLNISIMVQKVP